MMINLSRLFRKEKPPIPQEHIAPSQLPRYDKPLPLSIRQIASLPQEQRQFAVYRREEQEQHTGHIELDTRVQRAIDEAVKKRLGDVPTYKLREDDHHA